MWGDWQKKNWPGNSLARGNSASSRLISDNLLSIKIVCPSSPNQNLFPTRTKNWHNCTTGRNMSDCLFQSPFSFLFCAKITKIIFTKNPLATVVKKHVFSPAGETLIFRTFRQSYLIQFFQVCDRSDRMRSHVIACDKCDVACNIAAHYLGTSGMSSCL